MSRDIELKGRAERAPARILLVGAGAVGQVYGLCLQRGGARVDYLVRPKYVEELAAGVTLYEIHGKRGRRPVRFVPDGVFGSSAALEAHRYDQVWLCISTSALDKALSSKRSDISQLLGRLHGASLVVLQPGADVRDRIAERVPTAQIVDGGIAMVAYQAPLVEGELGEHDGEPDAPGIAFLLAKSPFTGRAAETIVQILRAGGCPAQVRENTRAFGAHSSSTLMPVIVALEGAGWKIAELRKGRWAELAAKGGEEARAVTEARLGVPPPTAMSLIGTSALKLATLGAPRLAPFDLEVYLRYHFSKVRDQTRLLTDRFIEEGQRLGVATPALRELRERVFG